MTDAISLLCCSLTSRPTSCVASCRQTRPSTASSAWLPTAATTQCPAASTTPPSPPLSTARAISREKVRVSASPRVTWASRYQRCCRRYVTLLQYNVLFLILVCVQSMQYSAAVLSRCDVSPHGSSSRRRRPSIDSKLQRQPNEEKYKKMFKKREQAIINVWRVLFMCRSRENALL